MRRTHETDLAPPFAVRYWAAVVAVVGLPLLAIAAIAAGAGASPLSAIALPWVVAVGAGALVAWRWRTHQLEVTDDAVVERRHPLVLFTRRRAFDEITEVAPCPADRRGLEHRESALLVACTLPERDLVVAPANPQQFLDDLAAADPELTRYRGRLVRSALRD